MQEQPVPRGRTTFSVLKNLTIRAPHHNDIEAHDTGGFAVAKGFQEVVSSIVCTVQERTQQYLEQLASGFSLRLSASRPAASAPSTAVERITKSVLVRSRDPATGQTILRERSLR